MISKFFRACTPKYVSARRRVPSCILYLAACFLPLASVIFLSCNKPFQPEVQYTPKLNVYSVLFANEQAVYVRVMSVVESPSDVSQPVQGATVTLAGTGLNGTVQYVTLSDTTSVIDGDTDSYYYAPAQIIPGGDYYVSVSHDGYPSVYTNAIVPFSYVTIPSQNAYSTLQKPQTVQSNIQLNANLSSFASAFFIQLLVEYRGFDASGKLHVGSFNVIPIDSIDPFTEIISATLPVNVDINQYKYAFNLAQQSADSLRVAHMYADIIVTQIDDNLYRFFITSIRTVSPLAMRTDKIIFTNIFNNAGTGVVAGASVDTTRVFLF